MRDAKKWVTVHVCLTSAVGHHPNAGDILRQGAAPLLYNFVEDRATKKNFAGGPQCYCAPSGGS